jgi:hypothetical protein
MPSLPTIPHLSRGVLFAAGAVVLLLLIWLWAHYGRRRYLVIRKSEATEAIVNELGRIADALERLAIPRETQPSAPVEEEKRPQRVNWLSMFGR